MPLDEDKREKARQVLVVMTVVGIVLVLTNLAQIIVRGFILAGDIDGGAIFQIVLSVLLVVCGASIIVVATRERRKLRAGDNSA